MLTGATAPALARQACVPGDRARIPAGAGEVSRHRERTLVDQERPPVERSYRTCSRESSPVERDRLPVERSGESPQLRHAPLNVACPDRRTAPPPFGTAPPSALPPTPGGGPGRSLSPLPHGLGSPLHPPPTRWRHPGGCATSPAGRSPSRSPSPASRRRGRPASLPAAWSHPIGPTLCP